MSNEKIAHLGFIQGVINRMGNNSFLVKGWSVTLVAAIFALSVKDADKRFMLIAYFPILVFWYLDGYFLRQEKLFRKLYEKVALDEVKSDVFTMDTNEVMNGVECQSCVMLSGTLSSFHGVIIVVVLFAMLALSELPVMLPCK